MDPRRRPLRPSPLLPTGLSCLGLSFLVTALDSGSGAVAGTGVVAWLQSAAWWVGMICVAGHVLRLALAPAPPPPAPSSSSESWGETQVWGPPSQR
ncbi:hypothetical protein FHN55_02840 [Streptomyces sp. NP160]|uniref:hypothetical protein n=1 Tax=Streptomyces sp. NP160 TaxID=2586637 RepID=UPI00111B1B23|nr:hypothetical protein [Streptomyces sp. NP160]TNM69700.1 hypothetical protein FHN55_02840 [Streptomyces sp. NP160]